MKPEITRKELANIIGFSEDGIKYHVRFLKKQGVIKRTGHLKGGYWEVITVE